jgi:hypothetical protein
MGAGAGYDPDRAAAAVRRLAAVSDQELAADARAGIGHVLAAWKKWRADPAYPRKGHPQAAPARNREKVVDQVMAAFRKLPDNATLPTVVDLAKCLLNLAWGVGLPGERSVADAVERLRRLAIHRPGLVAGAREIAKTHGVK